MFNRIEQPNQRAFLEAYAQVGNISAAAKHAHIDRGSHYVWMNNVEGYPDAFAEAHERAIDRLETEAVRRAVIGVDKPQTHKGRIQYNADGTPVTVKEYSNALLIFLLKAGRPHKYRDNYAIEVSGKDGGPIQLQAMRDQANLIRSDPESMRALDVISNRVAALSKAKAKELDVIDEDGVDGGNGDGRTGGNGDGRAGGNGQQ